MNPYAQGGWKAPARNAPAPLGNFPPQPSIFGALPFSTPVPAPTMLSFTFTSFNPNILNSTVTGPQSRVYFQLTTDTPTVGFTVVFDAAGQPVAVIEWLDQPVVEIRGILAKRAASQWLSLAQNRRFVPAALSPLVTYPHASVAIATARWRPRARCSCGCQAATIFSYAAIIMPMPNSTLTCM